jgi:hypothetical protein
MSEVLMKSQRHAHRTMYEDGKNVAFDALTTKGALR